MLPRVIFAECCSHISKRQAGKFCSLFLIVTLKQLEEGGIDSNKGARSVPRIDLSELLMTLTACVDP